MTDSTTWPPLNSNTAGMPRIWNLKAVLGLSSTLSLPIVTFPPYSAARASIVGARRLQGPHQSAQKSTRTGVPDWRTEVSKFPSVKVCTFSAAIRFSSSSVTGSFVYFDVLASRTVPGMVLAHASHLQGPPFSLILIDLERPLQGPEERLRAVFFEYKPRGLGPPRALVHYRVGQPANPPHDGHGAVPKAVHLVQPARLEM